MDGYDDEGPWPVGEPFVGWVGPPEGGFRWMPADAYRPPPYHRHWTGPWLIARNPEYEFRTRAEDRRWVDVIGDPRRAGFHRLFARLAHDDQGVRMRAILRFANLYGWLDERTESRFFLSWIGDGPGPTGVPGEPLQLWDFAVFQAAALVALWDLVRRGDRAGLAPLVTISPHDAWVRGFWVDGRLVPAADTVHPGGAGQVFGSVEGAWGPDEVVEPARRCLFGWINRELVDLVSPQLDPFEGPDYRLVPHTLLGAVYVHFMHEISGRRRELVPRALRAPLRAQTDRPAVLRGRVPEEGLVAPSRQARTTGRACAARSLRGGCPVWPYRWRWMVGAHLQPPVQPNRRSLARPGGHLDTKIVAVTNNTAHPSTPRMGSLPTVEPEVTGSSPVRHPQKNRINTGEVRPRDQSARGLVAP